MRWPFPGVDAVAFEVHYDALMNNDPKTLKIDFVSDVACPWCAVGLASLERAIERIGDELPKPELHFQPFELNPQMGSQGEDPAEYLTKKFGTTLQQQEASRDAIRQRGAEVGFTFRKEGRARIHNTFDAHRLLHWAGLEGQQAALKKGLLKAYFTDGESIGSHETLARIAADAGLNAKRASQILASDEYAADVRAQEQFYLGQGINSVPSIIINDRHLISGGQPPEVFEQALRQIAAGA